MSRSPAAQPSRPAESDARPLVAVTLGDVAGVGPETIVRALQSADVRRTLRPVIVGRPEIVRRALKLIGDNSPVVETTSLDRAAVVPEDALLCWSVGDRCAADVPPGIVDARAGQAAYDCLNAAINAALAGQVDAIVTAPLNKLALHLAGCTLPGHTEILAQRCGVEQHAMMLHLPPSGDPRQPHGLSVAHVTLHTSIASVPGLLSIAGVRDTIDLVAGFLNRLGSPRPRLGVCALNPHAGEEGLFGDEESRIIQPAVDAAIARGLDVRGPLPADTLFKRALADAEFDGLVAMYHDQGHIAFKLAGFDRAVNVTLGLPIIRTSPSQGTAFDIAWQGRARSDGMIAALLTAARLATPHC